MEKKYVANKAVLVNPNGQILLLCDAGAGDHTNSKGEWHLPGGRMEHNETPMEALQREVREEVGLEIDVAGVHPIHVDLWGVRGDKINEPIVGIFYVVPVVGSVEVVLSEEHTEFRWFEPNEALQMTFGVQTHAIESFLRLYGH